MRRKAVRSELEDAKVQKIMQEMERAMFFKEDTTFNDIRDKSLQQWLDEMEQHEDVAVRGGVKLTREYVQYLKDEIGRLRHENEVKNAYLKKLREKVPGLVLRTSLIAGLPYEDDAAFEELCDFLREVRIERAGVFPFSPEEGTKAALMEHVDMEEAQRRAELAVDVQSDIIDAYNDSILGEEREVLCEGYDPQAQMFYGRSYAESPDIDGRIWFTADSEIAPGSFVNVRLTGTMDGETTGELV